MSFQARQWAKAQPIKMTDGKCVLIALADCLNSETGACFPSQATLAFEIGTTERTIREHLLRLENAGYIKRTRRNRSNGTRTSDNYILMMDGQLNNQAEEFSPFTQQAEDIAISLAEDSAQLPEDFAALAEDSARLAEDSTQLAEESSPLEQEGLNLNYEPKLETEERTVSSSKNSKEKDALDAFIELWHKHKLPKWTSIQVLTKRRKAMLSKLISEAGSFEAALELFSFAIQEASETKWFQDRNLSLENIMSNDKIIQLGERFKTRQANPEPIKSVDLYDTTHWTAKDYQKHLGFVPDNMWGQS